MLTLDEMVGLCDVVDLARVHVCNRTRSRRPRLTGALDAHSGCDDGKTSY